MPSKQRFEKTTRQKLRKNHENYRKWVPKGTPLGVQKASNEPRFATLLLSRAARGAKMTPRPPPGAPGTLPSLVFEGFLVNFGRNVHDLSINFLIDFFHFSSASAEGRGTNRKNKQQTTNWMMVVMMMPMVLVCSLLMPVWGTVAGMPEAIGYFLIWMNICI